MRLTVSYEPHNVLNHSVRAIVQAVSRRPLAAEAHVGLGLNNVAGMGQASLKAFQLLPANYHSIISKY